MGQNYRMRLINDHIYCLLLHFIIIKLVFKCNTWRSNSHSFTESRPVATSERLRNSSQARHSIDSRLSEMRAAHTALTSPRGGWIHTIRLALGMSIADLATRLEVLPSTVKRLELSEESGTINFESLRRVADVLDCEVVYALVPRRKIGEVIHERALTIATETVQRIQETMLLEQQALSADEVQKMIEEETNHLLKSSKFWKYRDSSAF